jgi:surface protein
MDITSLYNLPVSHPVGLLLRFIQGKSMASTRAILSTILLSALTSVATANPIEACDTATYTLPNNQWRQISLPCTPVGYSFVSELARFFSLPEETYDANWVIYKYDLANSYIKLNRNDSLSVGVGYWIIQNTGKSVTLKLDEDYVGNTSVKPSPPAPVQSQACPSNKGCFEVPLATASGRTGWNMIGLPLFYKPKLGDTRVRTSTADCGSGCDLSTAQSKNLVHDQFWTYNESGYTVVKNPGGKVNPWAAYWVATLDGAVGKTPKLLVPRIDTPQQPITKEELVTLITNGEDVTRVNTSQITDMSHLFRATGESSGAQDSFNQDISGWDVSNVTDMSYMFGGREIYHGQPLGAATAFNQDISGWDVSNVTNMKGMFYGARSFTNQDLSRWNVSKVVDHSDFAVTAGSGNIEPNWKP